MTLVERRITEQEAVGPPQRMINLIEHALLSAVIIGGGVIRASPSEYLMANDWCSALSPPGFLIADETEEHRVE